jgi:superfamily II DNA helicase RecQ
MQRRALLCVKTGGGKSAVVQILATMMRGIHIILVPLLALGADQVSKGNCARNHFSCRIRAVLLDEVHDPQEITALRTFLSNMTSAQTLIIVASPQSLLKKHPWNGLLLHCALQRNLVKGFVHGALRETTRNNQNAF